MDRDTSDWWQARGITDHETYSLAVTGHGKTDPGDLFPVDAFLLRVKEEVVRLMSGRPEPTPPPPEPVPPAECRCEGHSERFGAIERRLVEAEAGLDSARRLVETEVMATLRHHNLRKP